MTWEIFVAILGVVSIVIGGVVSLRNVDKSGKKEVSESSSLLASMQSDLGYLKSGNDTINGKLSDMDNRMGEIRERVAKVEGSAASAHKRIDRLEGKET